MGVEGSHDLDEVNSTIGRIDIPWEWRMADLEPKAKGADSHHPLWFTLCVYSLISSQGVVIEEARFLK